MDTILKFGSYTFRWTRLDENRGSLVCLDPDGGNHYETPSERELGCALGLRVRFADAAHDGNPLPEEIYTVEEYDGGPAELVAYDPATGVIRRLGAADVIAWDRITEDPDAVAEHVSDLHGYDPYTDLYRVERGGEHEYYLVRPDGADRGWYAREPGGEAVHYPDAASAREAAEEYVSSGGYPPDDATYWVTVVTWQGEPGSRREDETCEQHTIALEPVEPKCSDKRGHRWESPHEIVGGIAENPGVWGHGGGVMIAEVCVRCGCGRHTDTWAQDPSTGEQGLTSVRYEEGEYSDALEAHHREPAES